MLNSDGQVETRFKVGLQGKFCYRHVAGKEMNLRAIFSAFVLLFTLPKANSVLPSINYLKNPGFQQGLSGWTIQGAVALDKAGAKESVLLGPGKATLQQRYDVPGLRILYVGAQFGPVVPRVDVQLKLTCLDARNREVMEMSAKPDAKGSAGIYTKTQAFTTHVIVSVELAAAAGTVRLESVVLNDDDRNHVEHAPQGSIANWMQPIWEGHEVREESVLLLSRHGQAASGKLLFIPTRIVRVTDSARGTEFVEGKDFVVRGQDIEAVSGSKIPTMRDTEFATGEFPWTDLAGRHVFVTYDHDDAWDGPLATPCENLLPVTMTKLKSKKPLVVVALGDSITLGINGTGFRNVPPYQPPWPTLFVDEIGRMFGDAKIRLYNTALGGMTSEWGKEMAEPAVAALNPDLVLIGFGMNDFWSLTPGEFRANIEATMATVRKRRPSAEFILVASIKFNPEYTSDPTYVGHLAGYAEQLRSMVGPGVAMLDMTAMSDALYKAKSAADLQTDPMHPDDFLSRWYAQSLVRMLSGG